jgi:hypothetical protein
MVVVSQNDWVHSFKTKLFSLIIPIRTSILSELEWQEVSKLSHCAASLLDFLI